MGLLPRSLPCRRAQHAHFCLQEGLLSAQLSLDQDVFYGFWVFLVVGRWGWEFGHQGAGNSGKEIETEAAAHAFRAVCNFKNWQGGIPYDILNDRKLSERISRWGEWWLLCFTSHTCKSFTTTKATPQPQERNTDLAGFLHLNKSPKRHIDQRELYL